MRRRGGKGNEASHLIKSMGEKEKGKRKKGEVKEKQGRKRGRRRNRERENFPVFRLSKLDDPRIKVGPRNESYAWVPKSVCCVKLQEVGVLSYFVYSLSKDHSMVMRHSPNRGIVSQ